MINGPQVAELTEPDTLPNRLFSEPPRRVAPPMIATAIRAAMRPYSMAVAPESSRTKPLTNPQNREDWSTSKFSLVIMFNAVVEPSGRYADHPTPTYPFLRA